MNRVTLFGLFCLSGMVISAAELVEETMVITATRSESESLALPYATGSIDMDSDMRSGLYRSVPESLRYTPGVMVQRTGHGQGSPFIRGFTSQRTLFMIDGVRLNNSVFREGPNQYWATVDPYSIERLEIVKGPGSVLYGSDAIGGTVQALTKGVASEGWTRHGNYRYSDAENSQLGRLDVAGHLSDRVAIVLGGTFRDFGDLEGGSEVGTQPQTAYEESAWDAKLIWTLNEDATLTFAHFAVSTDDAWRTHKTVYGLAWKGTDVGDELARVLDQNRALSYAQYRNEGLSGFADRVTATVSWHHQEEERFRTKASGVSDVQGFDVDTLGLQAEFGKAASSGLWTYGLEFYGDDVDSYKDVLASDGSIAGSSIQGPVADDASYDTLGVYVQNESEVTDQLGMILGLRYSRAEADASKVQDPVSGELISIEDDWDDMVASARLRYFLTPDHTAQTYAGISQGFRAPNLSDLTRFDSARSHEIETPSPGLDPEKVVSYELGYKMIHDQAALEVAYYYTDIDGMIVRTPTGRMIDGDTEITKQNGGDGYVQGIELAVSWDPTASIRLWGVVSWQEGEVETYPTPEPLLVTEPMSRMMPLMGHVGVRWTDAEATCWAEVVGSAAEKADDLSSRDMSDTQRIPPGGTPAYAVLSLRTGMKITRYADLTLSIENVTDEDYRVHGSGLNAAGRNFVAALDVVF